MKLLAANNRNWNTHYRVGSSVVIYYQELNELGVNDPNRAKESAAKLIEECLSALTEYLE